MAEDNRDLIVETDDSIEPGCSYVRVPSGEDAEEDADESSFPESSEAEQVQSALSRLKAPVLSDLCRKRKVSTNSRVLPLKSQKRSSSSSSDPSSVSPQQRAQEFASEHIVVSAGKLFCRACREELSLKKSIVQRHVSSSKHVTGKEKLARKGKREKDIAEALQRYDRDVHPSGETLPESVRVYRVKVLCTFLRNGVPISKIDDFRDLLEENSFRLAGRKPMSSLIPFVLEEERKQIKAEIEGLPVSVIFNGTTRHGEALAIIVRFVDRSVLKIHQRLVRLQILTKSMTGEEVARELLSVLSTEYGIASSNLLAAMHDRASVNSVAMRTLKVLYPNVLDIGCYSHTIDHVGDNFKTPVLHEFGLLWVSLFSHSPHARLLWRSRTGRSMLSYSKTRWWSRWEVLDQLMTYYGDVLPFLEENSDLSPATRGKLLGIVRDTQKSSNLQLELAAVVDAAEAFVKATYKLEGDTALVLNCFDVLASLAAGIRTAHFPNLTAVSTKLSAGNSTLLQRYVQYGRACVQPGLQYFLTRFTQELKDSVAAFKAARLCVPQKVTEMKPDASAIDALAKFPFLNDPTTLSHLKTELPDYLAKATDVSGDMAPLEWWDRQVQELPHWSAAVRKIILVQPSSAAAERVFSVLKASFNESQDHALQDYLESSLMLQYNKRE